MSNVEILRQAMKEYGLTYEKLAEVMDVSLSTVQSWLINDKARKHRRVLDKQIKYLKMRLRSRKKV